MRMQTLSGDASSLPYCTAPVVLDADGKLRRQAGAYIRDDAGRILAARVVVGQNDACCMRRRAAHFGSLAAITIATATEHAGNGLDAEPANFEQRALERRRRVCIVDDHRWLTLPTAENLHPTGRR